MHSLRHLFFLPVPPRDLSLSDPLQSSQLSPSLHRTGALNDGAATAATPWLLVHVPPPGQDIKSATDESQGATHFPPSLASHLQFANDLVSAADAGIGCHDLWALQAASVGVQFVVPGQAWQASRVCAASQQEVSQAHDGSAATHASRVAGGPVVHAAAVPLHVPCVPQPAPPHVPERDLQKLPLQPPCWLFPPVQYVSAGAPLHLVFVPPPAHAWHSARVCARAQQAAPGSPAQPSPVQVVPEVHDVVPPHFWQSSKVRALLQQVAPPPPHPVPQHVPWRAQSRESAHVPVIWHVMAFHVQAALPTVVLHAPKLTCAAGVSHGAAPVQNPTQSSLDQHGVSGTVAGVGPTVAPERTHLPGQSNGTAGLHVAAWQLLTVPDDAGVTPFQVHPPPAAELHAVGLTWDAPRAQLGLLPAHVLHCGLVVVRHTPQVVYGDGQHTGFLFIPAESEHCVPIAPAGLAALHVPKSELHNVVLSWEHTGRAAQSALLALTPNTRVRVPPHPVGIAAVHAVPTSLPVHVPPVQ